jgi:hypothetical protein
MPVRDGSPESHRRNNPGHFKNQQKHETGFAHIKFGRPLDPELFNSIAKDAAKKVASAKDRNNSTQLRRFYDELCLWDLRVTQNRTSFRTIFRSSECSMRRLLTLKGGSLWMELT